MKVGETFAPKCMLLNALLWSKAEPAISNVSKFGFPIKFFVGTLKILSA
jgi:hypothetical protein